MRDIKFNPSFEKYKSPVGAVKRGERIDFSIGINKDFQIHDFKIIIHKDFDDVDKTYFLHYSYCDGNYNYYKFTIAIEEVGLYWYCFEFCDCFGKHYISYQENLDGILTDKKRFWQLSIYNGYKSDLSWYKGKVMYQIMVDRFYNGGIEYRKDNIIYHDNWDDIPNYLPVNGKILNNDFFGGDLLGIIKKLDYLKELNVGVILLNPIFLATSNHKYDTSDYLKIDPMFGDENLFVELCVEAKKRGISIILDGVFNHTGDDSLYFNKYNNFQSLGAYQSKNSKYYNWYFFDNYPDKYQCWWNFTTLPKVNQSNQEYVNFITGENGVIDKWTSFGARGFRLDVVDEYIDPFIESLAFATKRRNSDNILIGEVWEDASNKISYSQRKTYFSGKQLDSVMNYPFRYAIIQFIAAGDITLLSNTLRSIINNYPKHVLDSLMNLLSTHDTERVLSSLSKIDYYSMNKKEQAEYKMSDEEYNLATQRLKLASAIQYTLPGVPCIFYGDEAGVYGFKDPFCRKTMPWNRIDKDLFEWYKKLGEIRNDEIFIDGDYKEEFINGKVFAYSRNKNNNKIIVIINNSDELFVYNFNGIGVDLINQKEVKGTINIEKQNVSIIKICAF